MSRTTSVDELVRLFEEWGRHTYDEQLSQVDHALQTAALAVDAGAGDELIAAALLHDVGHLLELQQNGQPDRIREDDHHEARGASYLGGLFPAEVTAPVALHVRAKRYLCAVDASYRAGLSAGSTASLERQGGPFAEADAATFARHPAADDALALRRWDDGAKVVGLAVAPLADYVELLERLAR